MRTTDSPSVAVSLRGEPDRAGQRAVCTVVWIRGEQDASTAPAISDAIASAIASSDDNVVVDLSQVTFLGVAALKVFVRSREILLRQSRSLALRSPSPPAQRVLALCGLLDLVIDHPEDAEPATGSAQALGTWLEVPATTTERDPQGMARPVTGEDPASRAGRAAARRDLSAEARRLLDQDAMSCVGRGAF